MSEKRFTNRLSQETSPYLLQHAHNPVDWYPWGQEALSRAREEDKPILLSVGYSACHWCHVMEHESFENEKVAEIMNRHFVNIKVDREERPDLDGIYMNFVQMTTGAGGWPMTVFMTPDQVPFYGGTYFPPDDAYGRPGFGRLLETIADQYQNRREDLLQHRQEILSGLEKSARSELSTGTLGPEVFEEANDALTRAFDAANGGFGGAPKFPGAMALGFLLRFYVRSKMCSALEIVEISLEKMAQGGIYDQLGGGFHRYSVDARWLVPHFEKMLYDNALLARLYLEAYQVTGKALYRRVVEETLEYVLREMTSPEGGFYSAQDADSEGVEGKFFVWTPEEINAVLGGEDGTLFCQLYDVSASGNFEYKNILNIPRSFEMAAKMNKWDPRELREKVAGWRQRLFAEREKRIKPGRDEKVLTAWNGMMLVAFAQASRVFDDDRLRAAARRNAEFLLGNLRRDGRLLRSYKDGQGRFNAYLEDYAQLIEGLIHLYMATFELRWLREAEALALEMIERFGDPQVAGFFFTAADHESLIVRQKEFYDNATPSGNSVATMCLLLLAEYTGKDSYRQMAARSLQWVAQALGRFPSGFGYWLQAFDFFSGPVKEIALVEGTGFGELQAAVFRPFVPRKIVALAEVNAEDVIPFVREKPALEGRATAYVCEDYSCKSPVTTAADLAVQVAGDQ